MIGATNVISSIRFQLSFFHSSRLIKTPTLRRVWGTIHQYVVKGLLVVPVPGIRLRGVQRSFNQAASIGLSTRLDRTITVLSPDYVQGDMDSTEGCSLAQLLAPGGGGSSIPPVNLQSELCRLIVTWQRSLTTFGHIILLSFC